MKSTRMTSDVKPIAVSKSEGISLKEWGMDSDSVTDNPRLVTEVQVAGRPTNLFYRMNNRSPWWIHYAVMDYIASEVSLVDTLIGRSTTEITRYGVDFEPAFKRKCVDCGMEFQNEVKVCSYCNSRRLIRPDERQKEYFVRPDGTSFLKEANDSSQSMKDLIRQYGELQYLDNEGYIVAITGDVVDNESKQLVHSYPLEFIVIDPKYVRNVFDETGKGGELYAFTMDDRHTVVPLDQNPDAINDRDRQGRVLYPVYWQVGESPGATGRIWNYTKGEVYHNHWFKQSMTYGQPLWMSIQDDLFTYHYIEKHNYKKYKYGYVRKIIILPGFSRQVLEKVADGVQDVLAKNDNSIPIVGLPPQPPGTGEMRAQTLELGAESSSDLMQIKNDIRDRVCALFGVPNLFVGDVMGSGGLNNESQQITTFDRYLMDKYDYADEALDWVLSFFPKITDWKLRVVRPSKADQESKRILEQLQIAQGFKGLGFAVTYSNGEFSFSEKPTNDGSANANMNVGQGFDGYDSEQADTDSEIDDSMQQADEALTASKDVPDATRLRKALNKGRGMSFRNRQAVRISERDVRGTVREIHRQGPLRFPTDE